MYDRGFKVKSSNGEGHDGICVCAGSVGKKKVRVCVCVCERESVHERHRELV